MSVLVQTDHGLALNGARGALRIEPNDAMTSAWPVTVEVLAQVHRNGEWLVVHRHPELAKSWALTVGMDGDLACYVGAHKGRWYWTGAGERVHDGQWHWLKMRFDGDTPQFWIDGRAVKAHASTGNEGRKLHLDHGLQIGSTIGSRIYGSTEALIAEVKLSSDQQTAGQWRFSDEAVARQIVPMEDTTPISLDELDRRSFKAGPAALDGNAEQIELRPGWLEDVKDAPRTLLDGVWEMADNADFVDAIPADVPGGVHLALEKSGRIPDPKFALQDAIAREQSWKTWYFRRRFPKPAGEGHRLTFDGVAVRCTVALNGQTLGTHDGMFGGPAFDVGHLLRDDNELVVKIEPIERMEEPTGWRDNKSWRKTVVFNNVYGWHYSYIPSLGIWRSVHLDARPTVSVGSPFIATVDAAAGRMKLRVDLVGSGGGRLIGVIAPHSFQGDWHRFEKRVEQPGKQLLEFTIPHPRLWWPNTEGEQHLYRLTVQFIPDHGPADRATSTFGIRTIEMRPQADGPKANEYNWTFVINGRPMFISGTGWCTMDSNLDFRRERYARFLQAAKDEHCKMVRAWGSGMPETEEFYDLCDELGLLVMQEWPTAWNSHEDQPLDALEETVRLATVRLRNRPSLVMWGGGNESNDPFGPAIDMMGRHAIELDGTRPFHRGEPWGGSTHNYKCWWEKAHLDFNLQMTSRFFGEFGIASLPVGSPGTELEFAL